MRVEFCRLFVPVSFERPDGTVREALTWVDTGGGAFQVAGLLASELGLVFEPVAAEAGEDEWEYADPAPASLGGRRIDFGPNKVQRRKGHDAALIAPRTAWLGTSPGWPCALGGPHPPGPLVERLAGLGDASVVGQPVVIHAPDPVEAVAARLDQQTEAALGLARRPTAAAALLWTPVT
jgi:hypothetical protein